MWYAHEQGAEPLPNQNDLLEAQFSADEVARLSALRQWFQAHPDPGDAEVVRHRLEFARWLVQHGKLTDE